MYENINIVRKSEHKTSEWSGGTTTQLYIYPHDAEYKKLNFKWRLSSAKVDVNESVFTHLPHIKRKIMILDGELLLQHEGHHSIKLKEFEQDSFCGDWKTKSYGRVTDFNLMMNDCEGNLEYVCIDKLSSKKIVFDNKQRKYDYVANVLYVVSGNVSVELDSQETLCEGDILLSYIGRDEECKEMNIINKFSEDAKIIRSNIYYNKAR
ncbi:HutD/Ves family protein [Tepidibacter mesophilus]|uniref:HutD/Ves family protein n=1 Tax=Tepidibacter mesophilus TaxID=655607 RepID=UPI000C070D5B|nr:HutD family protein [Tepidibacter mesophilus]